MQKEKNNVRRNNGGEAVFAVMSRSEGDTWWAMHQTKDWQHSTLIKTSQEKTERKSCRLTVSRGRGKRRTRGGEGAREEKEQQRTEELTTNQTRGNEVTHTHTDTPVSLAKNPPGLNAA